MSKWSKDFVVRSILGRYKSGQKLNSGYMAKKCIALYAAGYRYFGTWKKALAASGILYVDVGEPRGNKRIWSRKKIIQQIRALHSAGEKLSSFHVQKNHRVLHQAAFKYYGGWHQAVTAAGLDYESIRLNTAHTWSKETLLGEIKRLHKSGMRLNNATMRKDKKLSHVFFSGYRLFGSWSATLTAAGLDYSNIQMVKPRGWWTKKRIIAEIKSLEKRGVRLSYRAMLKSHGGLVKQALLQCGSWGQAVEAAGIDYRNHLRRWSTKAWLRSLSENEYRELAKTSK